MSTLAQRLNGTAPESLLARVMRDRGVTSQTTPGLASIPFGPWMPDLPDYANPGATVAKNVIPRINSYGPIGSLAATSDALDSRVLNGVIARDTTGNHYNYAGTATKLYEIRATGVTDLSKVGDYSTASTDTWEFANFAGTVVATNYADDVQSLTAGGGGPFADLFTSTNTPKARHMGVIREFLVLGNTNDTSDGVQPQRVWWSARNDIADMDPDSLTQSDYEDRPSGGWVQRVIGGAEYGLIFQENQIARMTYTGNKSVFQFDEIDRKRGTPIPNSVIGHGRLVYFISEEGFFVCDGSQSYPIGANQVDRTFWGQFDINNAHLVSAAINPTDKLVAWHFNNKVWFYNWEDRKFSEAEFDIDRLTNGTSEAYTLEGLDALALDSTADTTLDANEALGQTIISVASTTNFAVGDTVRITLNDASIHQTTIASISAGVSITVDDALPSAADSGNRFVRSSIDAMTISLDSPVWAGGGVTFGAYNSDHKLSYFTGANLAATLETGETELNPGRQSMVTKLRPQVDGGTVTAAVAGRNRLLDSVSYDPLVAMSSTGEVSVRNEARYHRFRCQIAAGGTWTHAQGIQVPATALGGRS